MLAPASMIVSLNYIAVWRIWFAASVRVCSLGFRDLRFLAIRLGPQGISLFSQLVEGYLSAWPLRKDS